MTPFEKVMEKTFGEYDKTARLRFLHPQMRMTGTYIGKAPAFLQVAKAPYDIEGFYLTGGLVIACEVKETSERETSLAIQGPEKKGSGLKYHQLDALVEVHKAGGLACVVWNNGGEVGRLDGSRLVAAKAAIDVSLRAEQEGYPNGRLGRRSILWGDFETVKETGYGLPLWLPPTFKGVPLACEEMLNKPDDKTTFIELLKERRIPKWDKGAAT